MLLAVRLSGVNKLLRQLDDYRESLRIEAEKEAAAAAEAAAERTLEEAISSPRRCD